MFNKNVLKKRVKAVHVNKLLKCSFCHTLHILKAWETIKIKDALSKQCKMTITT